MAVRRISPAVGTIRSHLAADSLDAAKEFTLYTVMWPERGTQPVVLNATIGANNTLTIPRPDGKTDLLTVTDSTLSLK